MEYLIFQLHKIKSLSPNNKCFNFYLYKTLNFVLHYIELEDEIIFPNKNNKYKLELKFCNFYLALNTILNSKIKNFELNEKIREILLEFGTIFQKRQSLFAQKINFNILFDTQLFKTNELKNYNKLFDQMIWHINNNNKDNSLKLFLKILLIDDIFETISKETNIKHKKYMNIISSCISDNKVLKTQIKINSLLVNYFVNLKSPQKIYHYLKIIYYNIDSIKNIYKENIKFMNYLITNYNKLDNYNCKYCRNIQLLCFLIYRSEEHTSELQSR